MAITSKATDDTWHKLAGWDTAPTNNDADKITTDQRGVTRASPATIGALQDATMRLLVSPASAGTTTPASGLWPGAHRRRPEHYRHPEQRMVFQQMDRLRGRDRRQQHKRVNDSHAFNSAAQLLRISPTMAASSLTGDATMPGRSATALRGRMSQARGKALFPACRR